ncbi:hypothetical protein A2U01_0095357, partial [Trifolium medium]|nr:hypothetical protein [Trifolium medium]
EPTLPSEPVLSSEVQRFRGYTTLEDEMLQRLLFSRAKNTQMLPFFRGKKYSDALATPIASG